MTTTVVQRIKSQYRTENEDDPKIILNYAISADADINDDDAYNALLGTIPDPYRGLYVSNVDLEPEESDRLFMASVVYTKRKIRETGFQENSFEIGVTSAKLTQSLATVKYPSSAPDYLGAMGIGPNNTIEGVDAQVPTLSFNVTKYISASTITTSWIAAVFAMTATTNNATFKGFAAGELLFLGVSGQQRRADQYEITYRFEGSPNQTNITAGVLSGISKKGWEFLEFVYADQQDNAARLVVKRPTAAYVHQVYKTSNFDLLGI